MGSTERSTSENRPDHLRPLAGPANSEAEGPLTGLLRSLARTPPTAPPRLPTLGQGDEVGRFRITRVIERGGFGVVYEAFDGTLGRPVALKVLPRVGHRTDLDESARAEAEATARLAHPGIVTLFESGDSEHGPYLVMELLRGETLAARLERGPVGRGEVLRIGLAIAGALAHAHDRGVLHRDLKPGNVFLTDDGRVKVLDLGLAHLVGGPQVPRGGTPAYSAPEQWSSDAAGPAVDVYATGAILFELESRRRASALPDWKRRGPVRRDGLGALVARCLERDPAARPADGAALLASLQRVERARARGRLLRRAGVLAVAAALVGAVVAGRLAAPPSTGPEALLTAVAESAEGEGAEQVGLAALVSAALEPSPRLRLLPRARMGAILRVAGLGPEAEAADPRGRSALAGAGVRSLYVAALRRAGGGYEVELRELDLARGAVRFAASERAEDRAAIPAAADALARRARARLGEDPGALEREAHVATALAPRLEAWALYDRGRRLAGGLRQAEALLLYRRAVELDPGLAPAQFQLAYQGYEWALVEFDRIDLAVRHLDRAGPRDRALIEAFAAFHDGRVDRAWELARPIGGRFPEDAEVAFFGGIMALHAGDEDAAGERFGRAVELDPGLAWARGMLNESLLARGREAAALASLEAAAPLGAERDALAAAALYQLGRWEAATEAARRALAAEPGDMQTRLLLATALAVRGDAAQHRREVESAQASTFLGVQALAPTMASIGLQAEGRFRESLRAFDEGWRAPWIHPERRAAYRAAVLAAAGEDALAREEARRVRLWNPKEAVLLYRIGADDALRELAGRMVPGSLGAQLAEALLTWREGKGEIALRRLRALEARARGWPDLMRAQLAGQLGYADEALRAYAAVEGVVMYGKYEVLWLAETNRAVLVAARCLEQAGRAAEARRALETLLHRWWAADADHPIVREARALCARLRCAGPDRPPAAQDVTGAAPR
ncbi:MAG TPA: serine/threonine-protein kinase [Anaeromyxobacteraceae bacterium]|nr:serine/threonine-protein kinase [Anaeromyxobacteraceae bacterium]